MEALASAGKKKNRNNFLWVGFFWEEKMPTSNLIQGKKKKTAPLLQ